MIFVDYLIRAADEPDPHKRMLDVASFILSSFWAVPNRTLSPFNPLLGETYELVTNKYKFISECVKTTP